MLGPLSSLLDPKRILLHVQTTERTAFLTEIAQTLNGCAEITNFEGFYEELLARDRLDTTNLGNGVALPHARTAFVKQIVMAVGRSAQGVAFEGDGELVKLVFVLGTPKTKPGDYLAVVSRLCKILRDTRDRDALTAAQTPEQFVAAFTAIEKRLKL